MATDDQENTEGTDTGNDGVVAAEDLSGKFPQPVLANFTPIKKPKYRVINPMKFAQRYGQFNREEILKNYELAKSIAMRELDTELEGLSKYAPAAAALKRQEISVDNIFNQQQRSAQIAKVMPGVADWLSGQADRALAYASGRMPSSVEDRALELGMRSQAADLATAGGFGASSSVARKASDLMSAQQRIQLSQYGDQLLTQNIGTTANLMLAPTEYSQAGSQISVMPEVGAGRLSAAALSEANALTMLSPAAALQASVSQRQFNTSLKMQTRQFNAQGEFAESKFNAGVQNQFALDKFGYQVAHAGAVAGAETANNMIALELAQQQKAQEIFQDHFNQSQQAGELGALGSLGGMAIQQLPSIIDAVSSIFRPSTTETGESNIGGSEIPSGSMLNTNMDDIEFDVNGPKIDGIPIDSSSGSIDVSGAGDITSIPSASINQPLSEFSSDVRGTSQDYSAGAGYTGKTFTHKMQPGSAGYNFQQATRLPYSPRLENSSAATQRIAGLTNNPASMPNAVEIGSNYDGVKTYSNPILVGATDTNAGGNVANTLDAILKPFGIFGEEDLSKLRDIGATASDINTLNELSDHASRGDVQSFINTGLSKFGKGTIADLQANPDKNGLAAAHAMYTGMQNFNQISPEQKSLLTAGFGLKATDFQGKRSLGEVIIPSTVKPGVKAVTAADTLKWFSNGINAYPLTKKWDQFSSIAKIVTGKNDKDTVATIAKQYGLLGAGINGAEVPGVTEQSLARGGWSTTPHLGVGAIKARIGSKVPQGYVEIANDGKQVVAAPRGTAYTAGGAIYKNYSARQSNSNVQSMPNVSTSTANAINWGVGAFNIYNMWQRRPGMSAFLGSANVIAQNVDAINLQKAIAKENPELATNYGQYLGSVISAYNAFQEFKHGDKGAAAGQFTQAGFLGAQAYYTDIGDAATAELMGKYAGYAGAGINIYNAIKAFQAGDTEAGIVNLGAGGATLLTGGPGAGMAIMGAYSAYKGWGSGDVKNGVVGGSMMLAGMSMMGMPVIGAGLMAISVIGNAVKTGKPEEQNHRDDIREAWQKKGFLVDNEYNVTLADGSLFNIGMDGDAGEHEITNPDAITNWKDINKSGKLRAYECDYTNDLDYTANMGGVTLTRLLFGDKAKSINQVGTEIGNAALGNIGYNQEMTKANFDKMQANMRAFYAKAGIGSKNDIYQLANAAFAEGRISESDLMVMHQTANMMFDDNGYDVAQQLMSGRNAGIKEAVDIANADKRDVDVDAGVPAVSAYPESEGKIDNVNSELMPPDMERGSTLGAEAQTAAIKGTRFSDLVEWNKTPSKAIQALGLTEQVPYAENVNAPINSYLKNRTTRMTKDQIQRLNQSRYAEAV